MRKKIIFRFILIGSLFFAVAAITLKSAPAHAQNWNLIWSDEFNGAAGTGLDTNNWLYDIGHCYPGCPANNWGTGEIELVTNSTANVYQDGAGHLVIKPIRDGAGNWTSGRVETQRNDFQPPVGGIEAVEASIQQPNVSGAAAAGYWPAFWMLGARNGAGWPGIGEFDILEDINGLSSVFGTLHCGVAPGGPCNEFTGIGSGQRACNGCQTGFHTYRFEYDRSVSPEQLRWFLDGVNYFSINATQVDATTWANATHHGFEIILNVAIGGGFPAAFGGGPTANTVSGVPMIVDYVRVFYSSAASGDGNPFGGSPYAIPGKVEAENYNTGGEGVAYHDAEVANQGGQYRPNDGVDIEATTDAGGGFNVGWTQPGEWMKYTVNVGSSGSYNFDFRVASNQAGGTFHLEVDGTNVTGTLTVPNTGGWQNWTDVIKNGVSLSAGQHVLRWVTDAAGGNYNWFNVSLVVPPTFQPPTNTPIPSGDGNPFNGTPYALPGQVEAENYNTGGEGVAYHDTEAANQGGQYRPNDGVDIEATTDAGGGFDVGWTQPGEWMKYTVNVTTGGTYTATFRVASAISGSTFHLEVDGANVTGTLTVPNTGGWQVWTTLTKTGISLSAGQHVLRWVTDAAGGNYNWMNFASGNPPLQLVLAINAGSGASGSYVADIDFDQGNQFMDASTAIDTSRGLDSNPAPQAVYQTCRWNANFTYTIPGLTPGGSYTVRLHWAELTWQAVGQRIFNVAINGAAVLNNFDVFATAGYKEALSRTFTTTANGSGQIVIAFTRGPVDNPFISGIEVLH